MGIFSFFTTGEPAVPEMARQRQADEVVVAAYTGDLKTAGMDRAAFDAVVARLDEHRARASADVIEVALRYIGGGRRPSSGKAAIAAINKRFLEKVRSEAKAKIAANAKTW